MEIGGHDEMIGAIVVFLLKVALAVTELSPWKGMGRCTAFRMHDGVRRAYLAIA
jgi:hypothetical protein